MKQKQIEVRLTARQAKAAVAHGFKIGLLTIKEPDDGLPNDLPPDFRRDLLAKEDEFRKRLL